MLSQKWLGAQHQHPAVAGTGWSVQRVAIIFTGIILNVYVHTVFPIWHLNRADISVIKNNFLLKNVSVHSYHLPPITAKEKK